mgnify:CR=1 FL=1
MSDKPIAFLAAAAVVAPLCALCVAGPAFLGSAVAWISGWFAGFNPVVTAGLAILAGLLVYGLFRKKRTVAASGTNLDPHTDRGTQ